MTQHQAPEVTSEDIALAEEIVSAANIVSHDGYYEVDIHHAAVTIAAHRTRATQPLSLTVDEIMVIARLRELLARAELPPLVSADSLWVRDEQRTEIYHVMSNRNTDHEMVWARSRLVAEVRNALPALLDRLQSLSLPVDIDRSGLAQEVE